MRLIEGVYPEDTGGEKILIVTRGASKAFHGMYVLNESAELIIRELTHDVTEEDLVKKITDTFECTEEEAKDAVKTTLERLKADGLLIEPTEEKK